MNTRIKGILQCALGALCWGASGIAGQYLLVNRDISPEWLTFYLLPAAVGRCADPFYFFH